MSESAPSPASPSATGSTEASAAAPSSDDPLSPAEPAEPPAGASLAIQLLLETGDLDPPIVGWLEPALHQLATLAGVTEGELTILAVDDHAMSDLHQQYAGVPGTTDVLTFDLADAPVTIDQPPPHRIEGDIAICLDEARRQAHAHGHEARLEALLYALHGLLHLLGEDDHDQQAYQRMHTREDELLQAVGLGAVFHRQGESPR